VTATPTFEDYLASLGRLSAHVDPTASTPEAVAIKAAATSLKALPVVDIETMALWVKDHPAWVPVLGLSVGLSQERLENTLRHAFNTSGWTTLARVRSFTGRNGRTAPCDLVIPNGVEAEIAVAAKGFDSTGSKLTDAVREIEEMADVRLPRQFVIAVIDGIGWKSRQADLRRIFTLWENRQIDGMYTLVTHGVFRNDIEEAARLRGLLR
jgi:hypothetical protein